MNSSAVWLCMKFFNIHMAFCDSELHEDHFYFWYYIHEPSMNLKMLYEKGFKGAVGSADLKISKSALLSLNHHNFSNTELIYTE